MINDTESFEKVKKDDLKVIFKTQNISEEAQQFLKQISIFPNIKWNKDCFKIKNLDILNELVNKNWLNKDDDKYYINFNISETIMYQFKPNYEECKQLLVVENIDINSNKTLKEKFCYLDIAKQFVEIFSDRTDEEYITLKNNVELISSKHDEYKTNLEWRNNTLVASKEVLGENHVCTSNAYNNVALLYYETGCYKKALEDFNKALVIKEKTLAENNNTDIIYNDVDVLYTNIAYTYSKIGEHEKALEMHNKALVVRKKLLGENHLLIATSYNTIARVYNAIGKHEKALEMHKKALAIEEKDLNEKYTPISHGNKKVHSEMSSLNKVINWFIDKMIKK